MGKVHDHGPEDGPGLSCNELRLVDGTVLGACKVPEGVYAHGTLIQKGAFKHQADTLVPVTLGQGGRQIGEARVSEDGEMINIELESGALPRELLDAFRLDLAQSFSIRPNYTPAVPSTPIRIAKLLSEEIRSSRWND